MTSNPMPPINPMAGPTPPGGPGRFKPIDPMRVLREHLKWFILAAVVGVFLGVGTWGVLRLAMPRYTAIVQLKVEGQLGDPNIIAGVDPNRRMDIIEAEIVNEIQRLTSEDILRQALERLRSQGNTDWLNQFDNLEDAREKLEDDILKVWITRGSTLFNVAVTTPIPEDARRTVKAVVDVYLLELQQSATGDMDEKQRAFSQELSRVEQGIDAQTDTLTNFTKAHNISSLDLRIAEATRLNETYTQSVAELQLMLSGLQESHRMLLDRQQSGETEANPEDLATVNAMMETLELIRRLDSYRENWTVARETHGENNYQAKLWRQRVTSLERELKVKREGKLREVAAMKIEQMANAIASTQAQVRSLMPMLEETRAAMKDLTLRLAKYEQLKDSLDRLAQRKTDLEGVLSDLRIYVKRPEAIRVRQLAGISEPELTFPLALVVIPGVFFLVMALTAGFIFLMELLDQRLKAPADVKLLKETQLLGTLPDAEEDPSGPTGVERVVEKYPTGLMAESFRQTRTAIMNRMDRRGYKSLMLVASQPECGTSTVTQNLATSFANHGRNVVIVDANFRRPNQHRLFSIQNDKGLVEVIRGRCSVEDAVHKIEGLSVSVLTTGHTADAPPELLESNTFRSVISELETKYDIVLIDAPPALLASDSQMLAKHVDAMACVVRALTDKRGMVDRMIRQLSGQRADILGVILNGVQSSAGGYFRKSYREFYRYRDQDGHATANDNGSNGQEHDTSRDIDVLSDADEKP